MTFTVGQKSHQGDAAPVCTGFEARFEQIRRDGVNESAEEGVVQPTDQLGVADSKAVERTVTHDHDAIDLTRFIPLLSEDADGEVESRIAPGWVIR